MSILYCTIILIKNQLLLSEFIKLKECRQQVKNLNSQILNGDIRGKILKDKLYFTFVKTSQVVYLCTSPESIGENKPREFIDTLYNEINVLILELLEVEEKKKENLKDFVFQDKLKGPIEKLMDFYNSGLQDDTSIIKEIQKDVDELSRALSIDIINFQKNSINDEEILKIKPGYIEELREPFIKKKKQFYFKSSVTKTLIYFLCFSTVIVIYIVFALLKCGNLNPTC
jgi:hypothetical protein